MRVGTHGCEFSSLEMQTKKNLAFARLPSGFPFSILLAARALGVFSTNSQPILLLFLYSI
jgi:hypothetical protein